MLHLSNRHMELVSVAHAVASTLGLASLAKDEALPELAEDAYALTRQSRRRPQSRRPRNADRVRRFKAFKPADADSGCSSSRWLELMTTRP